MPPSPHKLKRLALRLAATLALTWPVLAQAADPASIASASAGLFAPRIGMSSYADDKDKKRQAKAKKTKKACAWTTEKEWNRCERVKTMPTQPSNCDHLLPKC